MSLDEELSICEILPSAWRTATVKMTPSGGDTCLGAAICRISSHPFIAPRNKSVAAKAGGRAIIIPFRWR